MVRDVREKPGHVGYDVLSRGQKTGKSYYFEPCAKVILDRPTAAGTLLATAQRLLGKTG